MRRSPAWKGAKRDSCGRGFGSSGISSSTPVSWTWSWPTAVRFTSTGRRSSTIWNRSFRARAPLRPPGTSTIDVPGRGHLRERLDLQHIVPQPHVSHTDNDGFDHQRHAVKHELFEGYRTSHLLRDADDDDVRGCTDGRPVSAETCAQCERPPHGHRPARVWWGSFVPETRSRSPAPKRAMVAGSKWSIPCTTNPPMVMARTTRDFFNKTGSLIASFSFMAITFCLNSSFTCIFLPNMNFIEIIYAMSTTMTTGPRW